ncbi:aminotransferase class I/II-fold pyridoxal phosphate-dependent enzyme [Humibacter sp. BT305]|nr:aminotransferase class I/II-fold pyridoxal phosphate-dependent enzyme [Humibacter sp. BT305]
MTKVEADALPLLRQRSSYKWRAYPEDVLPLFVAETDYPIAPVVAAAVEERLRLSDTGYVASARPVADAFARFAERRWAWTIDAETVRATTDVSVAIVETLRVLLPPSSGVVIMPPIYPPFFELVTEAGHRVVEVPLADGERLDLDGLEAALAAGARAVLLCNPQNPIGRPHPSEELAALTELADRFGAVVVSDEIHAPLVHPDGDVTPFLAVSDAAARVGVCVTSASKGWNIAGFKCALIVPGSAATSARLDGLSDEVLARTSILGLHASVAAFGTPEGEEWLDGTVAAIVENRHLLRALLDEHLPEVGYREPTAGYLAWLDFRALGWGDDPAERILAEGRVALVPGPTFGSVGRGYARLNLACSPGVLTEAVERIAALR